MCFMKRKILLLASIMCGLGLAGEIQASLLPQKMVQFYAGVSFGAQRLSGHRNENAFYDPPGGAGPVGLRGTIYFANQKPFSNINGFYLSHIGFTWDIPQAPIFLGPEIYLGRGSMHNDLNVGVPDDPNFTETIRNVSVSLRQSTFWGGAVQVGFKMKWGCRPYMLLGLERSQFEYVGSYIPRSQAQLNLALGGPTADYPSTTLNKKKWLSGFLWGLGLERQIDSIKLGVDIRLIHYKEFKAAALANAFEPETFFTAIKPKNIRFGFKISYLF